MRGAYSPNFSVIFCFQSFSLVIKSCHGFSRLKDYNMKDRFLDDAAVVTAVGRYSNH